MDYFEEEDTNDSGSLYNDARTSMCSGLMSRVAYRKENNRKIHADNATKGDGPFYCPECLSDAIVRKCIEKNHHFAHRGRLSSLLKNGETELHQNCKDEILSELQKAFPDGNWAKERALPEDKVKGYAALVPDISGRINGKGVIIEVQRSFLNVKKIIHRTIEYTKRRAAIIWIVPIKKELGTDNFRPRLFEKFLHSMFYGRIYYWQKGFGSKVLPVHFDLAERWIAETTWFDVDLREERTEGGYWKNFKTIKTPLPHENLIDLTSDFSIEVAEEWSPENEELTVPSRIIYRDRLKPWWEKGKKQTGA